MDKPTSFRNEQGLLIGVDYTHATNEDGTINWRKMISDEFIVPNKQKTKETDISKLEDKDLLILLQGIKEVASLRGYSSVRYDVKAASLEYVMTSCTISWLPNYETDGPVVFSSLADAHAGNTRSFGVNFLAAIAENRAFTRCVRNFLGINIVGQEEIGDADSGAPENGSGISDPHDILRNLMSEKNLTFEQIKEKLIKEKYKDADKLTSVQEIGKVKVFEIIGKIKKKR